ncbi:MAG: YsnF/AvaK domain-containing protein [Chloroflexi bacterium]|nr:YsnF/AvaK domain-containing protein [Chloroflexota bacterium]
MARNYTDQLIDGMDVYDVHGDKIGSVSEIYDADQTGGRTSGSGGGYLRVPTGFLGLGREHHIPFSAIRTVDGDRINLSVPKEDLDTLGYDETPTTIDDDRADYVPGERTGATTTTTPSAASREVVAGGSRPEGQPESRRLLLREEELTPRKRTVQTGEVRLQTDVVEQQRTVEVPVTREEVYVERHAVERRPSERPISEKGETIEVPVHEDQVTVEKQSVVYEEVEVGTRAVQETESVDATVRREELRVEDQGNALQSSGARTTGGWAAAMPGYRSRWQQQYGSRGGRWEDAEPAYQYGYGLRDQTQYRGKRWADIEPDVERDWTRTHPNTPWDRASQSIRDAWENATDR